MDSASSCHTVTSLQLLDDNTTQRINRTVKTVDGTIITLTHKGKRTIDTAQGRITLNQVYYAEGLKYNLISVPAMAEYGVKVVFDNDIAYIEKGKNKIHLITADGLWALPEEKTKLKIATLRMERGGKTDAKTWHQRLGHLSEDKISKAVKNETIPPEAAGYAATNCRTCQLTRPNRRPIPHVAERSGKVVVQVDYMPIGQEEKGWRGEMGAYVFSSRYSKLLKAYPVKNASALEAVETLKRYCKFVPPFVRERIDCIQTDAGKQFTSKEWKETCAEHGLTYRTCPVDHQALNGQVERAIGALAAKSRAILMEMDIDKKFWLLAIEAATYVLNRLPHASLWDISPLEKGTGEKPDLRRCRVFGCRAYVQVPKAQRKGKLANTAWEGAMVGYSTSSPEWIILDPKSGRLRTAHSVTFDEKKSGFVTESTNDTVSKRITRTTPNATTGAPYQANGVGAPIPCIQQAERRPVACNERPRSNDEPLPGELERSQESNFLENWIRGKYAPERNEPNPSDVGSSKESDFLKDWINGKYEQKCDEHSEDESPGENQQDTGFAQLPNAEPDENNVINDPEQEDQLETLDLCMAMQSQEDDLPVTWRQALTIPHWKRAMETEKDELETMGAWTLVERPPNAKVLPGLWRFRAKKNAEGHTVRYKARWCADGSRDYLDRPPETLFSPVAEKTTVRVLFAIAATRKQNVLQADFPNAYLNADLDEEGTYVIQPKGLEAPEYRDHVCLLKKALYGSPVSGRKWHNKLVETIDSLGYTRSSIDHCLFYRNLQGRSELLTIYVDDLLVTSSGGVEFAERQLDELGNAFAIKKLGVAKHMLGMGVHQEPGRITLEQRAYLEGILREADFLDAKPRSTPWDSHHVEDRKELETTHATIYRRVLGQVMYLSTMTRPNIAFAVGRLATGASIPTRGLWERMKRLLRYLRGTMNASLRYEHNAAAPRLDAYVDSAFAVDQKRGRSITGYAVYLAGGPIYWRSHLQSTVADSPNAAEYVGLYEVAVAGVGIRNLLKEIGVKLGPITVHEDNDGARRLATDGMGQKKARHLSIKYHFVQDLCKKGEITAHRLPSGDQPADVLTKGTHTAKIHRHLVKRLGLVNYPRQDS